MLNEKTLEDISINMSFEKMGLYYVVFNYATQNVDTRIRIHVRVKMKLCRIKWLLL